MIIVNRYLVREAFTTWLAVTGVLLVIISSHRFARFLGEAAAGKLPGGAVFELLGYGSIGFLTVLVPVGFFLGLLMAFGRLYRDSEMTALTACGVGPAQLYRPVFALGVVVALLLSGLTLFGAPWAAGEAMEARLAAEKEAELGVFESGRFKSAQSGNAVFYAERVDAQSGMLLDLFLNQHGEDNEQAVVTAAAGEQRLEPETGRRLLVLYDGIRYDGVPGEADYRVVRFAEHGVEIAPSAPDLVTSNREGVPTFALLGSNDARDIAELQWRISSPLMLLVLAFIAVPLSRTRPREGRYGRIIIGVLVYVLYSNLLGVARLGVERGELPVWLGLWWVHLVFIAAGVLLLAHSLGFRYAFGRTAEVTA
ncbi:MAG TPA: LPS export ABC transporter permease LptF [Gammaproteobacteria bacterium]